MVVPHFANTAKIGDIVKFAVDRSYVKVLGVIHTDIKNITDIARFVALICSQK